MTHLLVGPDDTLAARGQAGLDKGDRAHSAVTTPPKGIVDPHGTSQRIRLARYLPSSALSPFVEHHWIVEWDLRAGAAETQRVLPYPNAHLVFEAGRTAVFGVVRGAFDRRIEGTGKVLGVRFRAGGLRPFLDGPVSRLTDKAQPLSRLAGAGADNPESSVLAADDDEGMIRAAEAFLQPILPRPDPAVDEACDIIAIAACEDGPTSVDALARAAKTNVRALQRLFADYVGVPPKWVIRRYRLHEAAWRLAHGYEGQLSALAVELGYYDQAHLARDFAHLVGCSPSDYAKSQRREPRA